MELIDADNMEVEKVLSEFEALMLLKENQTQLNTTNELLVIN